MDRPRLGETIAAAAGLALLLGMSIDWFQVEVTASRIPGADTLAEQAGGRNAWQTFELLDAALFVVAVIALAGLGARLTGGLPEMPVSPGLVVAFAGVAGLVAAIAGISEPGLEEGRFGGGIVVSVAREPGAWLSLTACAGIVVGGVVTARYGD